MPHDVTTLRTMEHATQAYVLLIDGIPLCFTTDDGELVGSGASSFIGRAESEAGETVGGREMRGGLIVPGTLEFGGDVSSLGLDRTTARFSVLLEDAESYFITGGEEPEEMLGRLAPGTNPAPASIIGVTVRDRYLGLEYISADGDRRMFPALMGEGLPGFDHHGDTDGQTVPASVSERPLIHEGRMVALYRVFRDPSALSESNSLAWPSLSHYRPLWVGKMRDAGKITAGGRISIECTGFETLLERNMATGAAEPFGIIPEFTSEDDVDDQVAIYLGSGPRLVASGADAGQLRASETYQGRLWTTLAGTTRAEIRDALQDLISDTVAGTDTDYQTGAPEMSIEDNGDAGITNTGIFIRKDEPATTRKYLQMVIAMHRRRWLALGYDPEQQDHPALGTATDDPKAIHFEKLESGATYEARPAKPAMGQVPGTGYYAGLFHTIALGGTSSTDDSDAWDNEGQHRYFTPLFVGGELVRVIKPEGGQVARMAENPVLIPQSHVPYSGNISGSDCDAAGFFLIKGKIRKGEGSSDDASLIIEDETEQVVIARCSWIIADALFADPGAGGVEAGLYIEQLYDPRGFGYPFRPLDRDWATLELQAVQLQTYATGSAAGQIERVGPTLSAFLRSTGTSTGPAGGVGVIDQGENSGTATGFSGDIFSAELGLGIPSSLLPTQAEITEVMDALPGGASGELARARISYESSFSSADTLKALLEPRGLRMGFDGGRLSLFRLREASPEDATINILESDLYGTIGDPTSVYPDQGARALAPIDAWQFKYANSQEHEQRAKDPGAPTRRGDNDRPINGRGLIAPELYGDDPTNAPIGAGWKEEARTFFGHTEARFFARRHGIVTVPVSRPKGQDIYPGTLVTISNPWIRGADGSQGVSGVVGRVLHATHHTDSGHCEADILVFEGQYRPPPLFAPMLWIEEVVSSTQLTIATSTDFGPNIGSTSGWVQPAWSVAGSGNAILSLFRMLPDTTWVEVGTAQVSTVTPTTINLATALTALPPNFARTMVATLGPMDAQPEWAQEIYSAVGIQGDNTRTRQFV